MNVIEIEVFNKLFASIAEEMGIILTRSSFSSNIKERRDFSCAVFDIYGDLIAQAAHIPVHLGAMPETLRQVLAFHNFRSGDVIIVNDPFQGGSHLPDITLIEAVFGVGGKILFYVANRAHHADVGGKNPGSMGFVTNISDEGVIIPPTLLVSHGKTNDTFLQNFLQKVRNPEERMGDLRAQLASLKRGKERLRDLYNKYGDNRIDSVTHHLKAYAERLMRNTIAELGDGTFRFCDFLDNDGIKRKKIPIAVKLTINDGQATIDFSASADQVASPLNTVKPVVISASIYAFQCLMGEGFPINQGSYRPIQVITRPGSLLHALPPAPVAAGNVETSQRIVDVLFGALALAAPEKIPAASCGSMNNIAIGGIDNRTGKQFTYYETIGGGMGARPQSHGISAIHTHMTNTLNTPVEALEHNFPLQIDKYAIRYGSGGQGFFRGGNGIIRSYRFLSNAQVSLLTERRVISPYGLQNGQAGRKGENILKRHGKKIRLTGKNNFTVQAGDKLIIKTPGGGGWGGSRK